MAQVPICPACHVECEHIEKMKYQCPRCGEYYKIEHLCPVCNLPGGKPRTVKNVFHVERSFYAHDDCFKLIVAEADLDRQQYDTESERFTVAMKMDCPDCHKPGCVIMDYHCDGTGFWVCMSCGVILDTNYVNGIISQQFPEPLKCNRCGEVYTLDTGHKCELAMNYNLDIDYPDYAQ